MENFKNVRIIDANALKELLIYEFKQSGEYTMYEIGIGVALNHLDDQPTIDPESLKSNKRMIPLDEVYRVIAGHSDYNGDDILAALTCIAEGKDVKPVKPLESLRPHGKWVGEGMDARCGHCGEHPLKDMDGDSVWYWSYKPMFCPNCGATMEG